MSSSGSKHARSESAAAIPATVSESRQDDSAIDGVPSPSKRRKPVAPADDPLTPPTTDGDDNDDDDHDDELDTVDRMSLLSDSAHQRLAGRAPLTDLDATEEEEDEPDEEDTEGEGEGGEEEEDQDDNGEGDEGDDDDDDNENDGEEGATEAVISDDQEQLVCVPCGDPVLVQQVIRAMWIQRYAATRMASASTSASASDSASASAEVRRDSSIISKPPESNELQRLANEIRMVPKCADCLFGTQGATTLVQQISGWFPTVSASASTSTSASASTSISSESASASASASASSTSSSDPSTSNSAALSTIVSNAPPL